MGLGRSEPVGETPLVSDDRAIPAATAILLRDTAHGPETLMLRRNAKLDFAGGAWVFPGGKIEEEDGPGRDGDPPTGALVAAVRETEEECGLTVDQSSLVLFSRWTPPNIGQPAHTRFTTWFFAAPAPSGTVTIDGGEIHDRAWMRPADAMERAAEREIQLLPPTWVTLHRLAALGSVEEILTDAASSPIEHFSTVATKTDAGRTLLWHGDAGYDTADPLADGPRHRLEIRRTGWNYLRHL